MIDVKYVEYDTSHPADFEFNIPEGHECWLLVLTHIPAIFFVEGEYGEFPSNHAVLYKPKQKIDYRACSDYYSDDWIRFDTDESYVTKTPITCGKPLSCMTRPTVITFPIVNDRAYYE